MVEEKPFVSFIQNRFSCTYNNLSLNSNFTHPLWYSLLNDDGHLKPTKRVIQILQLEYIVKELNNLIFNDSDSTLKIRCISNC